jgi:uncharacterized protein (DUF2132 family)
MTEPSRPKENRPSKDPLHGITLERMLKDLVGHYGWEELGERITINCFQNHPSISSSLRFLRKTPWARTKVEKLYLKMLSEKARKLEKKLRENTPVSE